MASASRRLALHHRGAPAICPCRSSVPRGFLYWDTNGTGTAGSGAATGTWGTDAFWTTDATGANVGSPTLTAATTNADDLFFSAGTNGTTGTGTINFNEAAGVNQGMGVLTLTAGQGTVQSTWAGSSTNSLTFSNVTARSAGAFANFVQSDGTNGTDNSIILTQYNGANTVAGAFIDKGVFFNGSAYAVANSASGYLRCMIYGSDTNAEVSDTITASKHVQLTTSPASRVGDTLLSLNLAGSGVNYTMSSGTLTVPGILKSGGGTVSVISGGTAVTAGASHRAGHPHRYLLRFPPHRFGHLRRLVPLDQVWCRHPDP